MNRLSVFQSLAKFFLGVSTLIFVCVLLLPTPAHAFPGIITYQGKLTNTSGASVSDGNYSIKFTLYDASTGGTCKYTASGTCGTPTALTTAVSSGIFSVAFGGSSTNSLDPTIFQSGDLYLGVTVGSDSEMSPRKQLTNTPFAYNALYLSGLATSTVGGTSSYIPAATSNGNFTFTGTPQGTGVSQGSVYINPSSTTADYTLLGIAVGGTSKFKVDKEGDTTVAGTLTVETLLPDTANTWDVGSVTTQWSTVWANTLRYNNNGYLTLHTSGNIGISSSTPGRALDVAGGFMISGNGILGDNATDTLTVNATSTFNAGISSQTIIPLASNTYDIGSAATLYRNIYATGTTYVTNLTVSGTCTGCANVTPAGFTDGGSLISLTTATDMVGVGTSTIAGHTKLHIVQDTNDVSLRVTLASGQTRNMTEWVNAASTTLLSAVDYHGSLMIDPTGVLNDQYPTLMLGTNSVQNGYNSLIVKHNYISGDGYSKAQVGIFDNDGGKRLALGFDDSGIENGQTGGQGYINAYNTGSISLLSLAISGSKVFINGTPGLSDSDTSVTGTAALTVNYAETNSAKYHPATLTLQKFGVDKLRIYTTSTQAVVFQSQVANSAGTSAFVFDTMTTLTSTTDRGLFSVRNGGNRVFSIDGGGNVFSSGAFIANTSAGGFPGDLAEYVPITAGQSVEAGDVIMMDPANPIQHIKSTGALQKSVAGVISNTGAFVIGSSEGGRRVPLALAGLVYVKATDESGAIASGDLLVTASEPGAVMKYNPATQTGEFSIVGMAMEPLAAGEHKKILSHVRNLYSGLASATTVSETSNGQLSLHATDDLVIASLTSTTNTWSISRDGLLVSSEIETKSLGITDSGNGESTIGEGYVAPGEQIVTILSTKVTAHSKIFVTFKSDLKGRSYYVSSLTPGESFMVSLSSPTDDPLVFDWWIVEKKVHDEVVVPDVPGPALPLIIGGAGGGLSSEVSPVVPEETTSTDPVPEEIVPEVIPEDPPTQETTSTTPENMTETP